MADDNPIDTEHTLTVTLKCASATAAYAQLENIYRAFKVLPGVTDEDFDDDNTFVPVGTEIPLMTQSKTQPTQIGTAVVNPVTT